MKTIHIKQDGEKYEIKSILNKWIRLGKNYWIYISHVKHEDIKEQLDNVFKTILNPCAIYQDSQDKQIFTYYYKINKHWFCVVVKHLNGGGYVITVYMTSKTKRQGNLIWQKNKTKKLK